jgi:hypothetical protein
MWLFLLTAESVYWSNRYILLCSFIVCMYIEVNNESVLKKHFDCNKVPEALLKLIMQGLIYWDAQSSV